MSKSQSLSTVPSTPNPLITNTETDLSISDLLASYNLNPEDFKESTASATHYWNASKGASVHGIIIKKFERLKTDGAKYDSTFYVMQLLSDTVGVESATQEAVNLAAGENILILARNVLLRELSDKIDKEVVIVCLGQHETSNGFEMWDYKVFEKKSAA